jgi:hypothetical protein
MSATFPNEVVESNCMIQEIRTNPQRESSISMQVDY